MVTEFNRAFDAPLRMDAAARNLTPRDVVTLASIIEKETARPEERPIVSAVYQNRLKIGMPLQCDPTVIYAMMLAGTWNGNIRRTDLADGLAVQHVSPRRPAARTDRLAGQVVTRGRRASRGRASTSTS